MLDKVVEECRNSPNVVLQDFAEGLVSDNPHGVTLEHREVLLIAEEVDIVWKLGDDELVHDGEEYRVNGEIVDRRKARQITMDNFSNGGQIGIQVGINC